MLSRSRFVLGAVLTALVLLSGCLTTRVNPGETQPAPTPFTSPAGTTYDWLWLSWTEDMADNALVATGAQAVWVAVCFPALGGPWPRMYFEEYVWGGTPVYAGTTAAACTNWMPLAIAEALPQGGVNLRSTGWQRLAGIGGGETFTVHLLFERNWLSQPQDVWTSVRVANEAHTIVWYESL